ncbi:MAG: hypothetical protein R6X05_16415 [Desulfobacterales bacterium]
MRRSGGKPVQRRQLLLVGERHFGCGKGVGHVAGLAGHRVHIETRKDDAADQRRPYARLVEIGQFHRLAGMPWQRPVMDRDERDARRGQPAQQYRTGQWQGCRRNGNGHHEQERERIGQPTGQIDQDGELQDVIGKHEGRKTFMQPSREAPAERQRDVQPGRKGDDGQARSQRQRKAKPEMDQQHRNQLTADSQPAQPDRGAQPQALVGEKSVRPVAIGRSGYRRQPCQGLVCCIQHEQEFLKTIQRRP